MNKHNTLSILVVSVSFILLFSAFSPVSNNVSDFQNISLDSVPNSYLDTVIAWDAELDMSMVTVSRIFPGVMETTNDTIFIYDMDLDEEVEKVVESEHIKTDIILKEPFVGSYYVTDTVFIFDPATEMETIHYVTKKVLGKKK